MSQRSVLITGAGGGVGQAAALAFHANGWRVVAGVRDMERAQREFPDAVQIVALDVTLPAEIRAAVALAGPIDCLVNNAAYAVMGAQEDANLDDVRAMFETNLFGAAAVAQAVLPQMRERGAGVLVQVSSVGAWMSNPLVGFYHATKYALAALSEALAVEMAPFGVRVVMIEPGMIDTNFTNATKPSGSVTDPNGPYGPMFAALRNGFAKWRSLETSSADAVATAIVSAAQDLESPFRVRVGLDAETLHAAKQQSVDDADWHRRLRSFLGMETISAP